MFHPGEQQAQQLAGFHQVRAAIYDQMPQQHQLFYAQLPYLLLAQRDQHGWPLAHLLMAAPGFVQPLDENHLAIQRSALQHAPLLSLPEEGEALAILGIDFATRRRNRANGEVAALGPDHLVMRVLESFGNCPQYIHQYPWQVPMAGKIAVTPITQLSGKISVCWHAARPFLSPAANRAAVWTFPIVVVRQAFCAGTRAGSCHLMIFPATVI